MDLQKNINIRLVQCVEKYPFLYNTQLKAYHKHDGKDEAWAEIAAELNSTPEVVRQKWKRLRSVFVGTLKQMHMGELIKPYYLHEHLQFVIPHLLVPWDPERRSKQLLEESEQLWSKNKRPTNNGSDEDLDISEYFKLVENPQQSDEANSHLDDTANTEPAQHTQRALSSNKRKRWNSTDSERDNYPPIKEYKRDKLKPKQKYISAEPWSELSSDDTEDYDPKTHFLLSMLPDVEEMNNSQMRLFKAKVLLLITDILDNTIDDEI